jgi:hypothetical protein
MRMRLLTLLHLIFLAACASAPRQGPLSPAKLRKLEAGALRTQEFASQLRKPSKPALPRITLPFRLEGGVPVVEAVLNGRKARLIFDTGATRTVLQAGTAIRHGVPVVADPEATATMSGVVGREQARVGLIRTLELGSWRIDGLPCLVRLNESKISAAQTGASTDVDLLGFDLLRAACSQVILDHARKQITLEFASSKGHPKGPRASISTFKLHEGVPAIRLRSGRLAWDAIFDTGSFNGIEISPQIAARLGFDESQGRPVEGLYLIGVGGTLTSDEARLRTIKLPSLTLLGQTYENAEVDISPGIPRVGQFFLKDYLVTLDLRRQQIWLEW